MIYFGSMSASFHLTSKLPRTMCKLQYSFDLQLTSLFADSVLADPVMRQAGSSAAWSIYRARPTLAALVILHSVTTTLGWRTGKQS